MEIPDFEGCLLSGNTEDRTAGNERERDRVREREREIPEFPKPPAPALRFGSMNPISRLLVHGVLWPAYYGDSERIFVF